MNTVLETFGIIGIVITLLLLVGAAIFIIRKIILDKTRMTIYGDVILSMKEEAVFYVVDNVSRQKKGQWDAELDNIRLYALGKEISVVAYKAADVPHGIRLLLSGAMNSSIDVTSLVGAVKYKVWEISFDAGATRQKLRQVQNRKQYKFGLLTSHSDAMSYETHLQKVLQEIEGSERASLVNDNSETHGMIAHINEGKTTGTTMRYQILIPQEHPILKIFGAGESYKTMPSFYHLYEGSLYKLESKFVDKVGSLYEYDLIGLEPGKIYVGLSISLDGGIACFPSSSLYGITKDHDGEVPTIDDAILAKPKAGAEQFRMWNEYVATEYLGEELTKRMYDVIVKKHYEDEYKEDYLALSRTQEFYADYNWLKGHKENKEEDIHVLRHVARVKEEAKNKK